MDKRCLLLFLLIAIGCQRGPALPAVPVSLGRERQVVRLPGLSYLTLGMGQRPVLAALRERGYQCDEAAATPRTMACLRSDEAVLLEFDADSDGYPLQGVQVQPAVVGRAGFEALSTQWLQSYGSPKEVRRPGITALRHELHDGSVLLLVYYDEGAEGAAMTLEQVRLR